MGNNDSKHNRSTRRVSADELNHLARRVHVKSENSVITQQELFQSLGWNSLDNRLIGEIWTYISQNSNTVRFGSVVDLVDSMLYQDQHSEGMCLSHFVQGPNNVQAAISYSLHLIQLFETVQKQFTSSWQESGISFSVEGMTRVSQFLTQGIQDSSIEDKAEFMQMWLEGKPLLRQIQTLVFKHLFQLSTPSVPSLFPVLMTPLSKKPQSSILDPSDVLIINSALPHDMQTEWSLVFSTATHGLSFTSMLAKISNKGPNVIIVEDSEGHIFGGFAPTSWIVSPKFAGDERSFLFKIRPEMSIFHSTGYNNHYMYLNHQQQTMPNGLGMGGQLGYFGIWIDADFGHGHSSEGCSTFHRMPTLSAKRDFLVEHIEVWAVGPPPKDDSDDETDNSKRSILDKDSGAKALLEMIDRGHHSEGLREVPEEQ